jgi:predicted nucleic acid-binding protein
VPVLLDSSVYIAATRRGDRTPVSTRSLQPFGVLWLSAVVLEELYAGSLPSSVREIEKLEQDFTRLKRVLVPTQADWTSAGRILARVAGKYDYEEIGRSRLVNDALIASSAARTGTLVFTLNAGDFARIAEFRPFRWQVLEF